ncbi:MAG: hypothetical protein ACJ8EY_11625 [Sphingomicrobium sp.]
MLTTLRRWWRRRRDTPGPGAVLIDLGIVIVGVFAAQQLSNWNEERVRSQQVEDMRRDLFYSFDLYRRISATYLVAIPCIRERVDTISTLAGEQRPVDPELLKPATLMKMGPDEVSRENDRLLRDRYGNAVADQIGSVEFNLQAIQISGSELEQRWFEFERLNGSAGGVDQADRAAARGTAVQIKGDLFTLEKSAKLIIELTRLLEVPQRSRPFAPVRNCQDMWRKGLGYDRRTEQAGGTARAKSLVAPE